ncbi:1648_t:CDS:2, partial [Funneliformis geosporum]
CIRNIWADEIQRIGIPIFIPNAFFDMNSATKLRLYFPIIVVSQANSRRKIGDNEFPAFP